MWHHRCEAACTFVKVCIPSGLRIDVTGLLTATLSRHWTLRRAGPEDLLLAACPGLLTECWRARQLRCSVHPSAERSLAAYEHCLAL